MRIASAGHAVFAVTIISLGILGLIKSDLNFWELVYTTVPVARALAYICGFIPVACGIGLLLARAASPAARLLLAYLLLWLLVFRAPGLLHALTVDVYWSVCEAGVMVAAAWVLYVWFAAGWDRQHLSFATSNTGLHIARALYGASIIPFGIAHFQYVEHTASMVPSWLPAHVAWVYFTGTAFIAAGIAVLIGVCARLAAVLSALQMGLFLLLVWVPAMATRSLNSFQWGEVLATWVLTAAGWVVADSYRGIAWLAIGNASEGARAESLSAHSS